MKTISDKNALSRLYALQKFLDFVKNNQVTEFDRIILFKKRGNVALSDLGVKRNSTRIKRRSHAE